MNKINCKKLTMEKGIILIFAILLCIQVAQTQEWNPRRDDGELWDVRIPSSSEFGKSSFNKTGYNFYDLFSKAKYVPQLGDLSSVHDIFDLYFNDFTENYNFFEPLNSKNATPYLDCAYYNSSLVINQKKLCDYRNNIYPDFLFEWWTSSGCYTFLQSHLVNTSVPRNVSRCIYSVTPTIKPAIPCFLIIDKNGEMKCYQIHESIPEAVDMVKRTVVSDAAFKKWKDCSRAAMSCCYDIQLHQQKPDNNTCRSTWDAWTCWLPSSAGMVHSEVCNEFAYSNTGPSCNHYSMKECFANATWNPQTNYSTCTIKPRLIPRVKFHMNSLAVSLAFSIPAVIILLSFRRLRVRRLALHRNLLIAILVRNIMVIVTKNEIIIDELESITGDTVMSRNGIFCKILVSLEKLAASTAFACMLVDGIYLHRSIVAVFKRELNIYIVNSIVAAATIIPVIIWICLMATLNDTNCWIVYDIGELQWVLDSPRIAMLVINTILLIDILRILFTKLRRSENKHQVSTAKATLFLMPLFGVQFLLTAWRPNTSSCDWEQGYYFFTYIMEASQGIIVALLYCYLNKEVHILIRTTYKKTGNALSRRFQGDSRGRRSTGLTLGRRDTCSTTVDPGNNTDEINTASRRVTPHHSLQLGSFSPSLIDSGIDEDGNYERDNGLTNNLSIEAPGEEFCNSLTLFNNAYSPSEDGFISMNFENDVVVNGSAIESINRSMIPREDDHHQNDSVNNDSWIDNSKDKEPITDCLNDVVWTVNPFYMDTDITEAESIEYENIFPKSLENKEISEIFDPVKTKKNAVDNVEQNAVSLSETDIDSLNVDILFSEIDMMNADQQYENIGVSYEDTKRRNVDKTRPENDTTYMNIEIDLSKLFPNGTKDEKAVFVND